MVVFLAGVLAGSGAAQEHAPATAPATAPPEAAQGGMRAQQREPATQAVADDSTETEHEVSIGGRPLKYTARAGLIALKDDAGKTKGQVFFVAYEAHRDEADDVADRPITFVFNGGPGAAAVWLHLGTAGPMRVALPEDGSQPPPPYRLEENPHSWLDLTDLVFIDPVGTGFSRPADNERAREFYGVEGDVASVAEFIRLYLTRYGRWASPKFLAGESYGTTRAAALSEHLHDRFGIDLNGIVLISTVLNFQTIQPTPGNDLPYPLFLPTYAATAWYHKKLPAHLQEQSLEEVVRQAETWAFDEYISALMRGTSLSEEERRAVVKRLAMFTGLPEATVERSYLRISPSRFEKLLLADEQRVIGRMDGRLTGHDADPLNDTPGFDPSLTGYVGPFSSTFNQYVREELKYESDLAYEFLSPRIGPWDFGPAGRGYLDVGTRLREAMTKVPAMKVMLASGYYDLATPFAAADYTINQLPLSPELRRNIMHEYYEGGHMMYLNTPSLAKLKKDLAEFYESAFPTRGAAQQAPEKQNTNRHE